MEKNLFQKKAMDGLNSPDDLEKYLRIANPGVWMILAACIALLLGLLAWGIWGEVSSSVDAVGVSLNGEILCLLSADDAAAVSIGDIANFGGTQVTISDIAKFPLSKREAEEKFESDYLISTLMPGDWAYQVTFSADRDAQLPEGIPVNMRITTGRVAPISLILNN